MVRVRLKVKMRSCGKVRLEQGGWIGITYFSIVLGGPAEALGLLVVFWNGVVWGTYLAVVFAVCAIGGCDCGCGFLGWHLEDGVECCGVLGCWRDRVAIKGWEALIEVEVKWKKEDGRKREN